MAKRKTTTTTATYINLLMEVENEPELEVVNGVKQYTIFHELHYNLINNKAYETEPLQRTGELPSHHQ